jgi:hypothetical protein
VDLVRRAECVRGRGTIADAQRCRSTSGGWRPIDQAAVDLDELAGDVLSFCGAENHCQIGHVFGRSEPRQ